VQRENRLEAWFQGVTAGTPACVFCDDTEDIRHVLEQLATSRPEPARVVALTWTEVPPLSNELNLLIDAVSASVLGYYPALYARECVVAEKRLDAVVRRIVRRHPNVLGAACKQILTDCDHQRAPKLSHLPSAEQVRQLALAIDPERLLIIITVQTAPAERLRLRSLAQGAEWLASNAQARVALVLPSVLRGLSELDHVTYRSCVFSDSPGDSPGTQDPQSPLGPAVTEISPPAQTMLPRVSTSPTIGRPHSDVERALYDRLIADPDLQDVFAFNQRVVTCDQSQPIVDLIWTRGKLVIELDGEDHRRPFQFASDRTRDYWLVMSGYRVLRFTNASIIERCDEVVSMIRAAVRYIGSQEGIQ